LEVMQLVAAAMVRVDAVAVYVRENSILRRG
jgi:hypothetical protein